jgi:hypothetical protein
MESIPTYFFNLWFCLPLPSKMWVRFIFYFLVTGYWVSARKVLISLQIYNVIACFTRSKKLMNFLTLNLLLRVIHKIVNKLTTIN